MEVGYYCEKCNKVHPECWVVGNEYICYHCDNDINLITITLINMPFYLKKMNLKANALDEFKRKSGKLRDFGDLTDEEITVLIDILNKKLRRAKIEELSKM